MLLFLQRRNGSKKGQVGPVWNLKVGRIPASLLLSVERSLGWTQPADCGDRELWLVSPGGASGRRAARLLLVGHLSSTWGPPSGC